MAEKSSEGQQNLNRGNEKNGVASHLCASEVSSSSCYSSKNFQTQPGLCHSEQTAPPHQHGALKSHPHETPRWYVGRKFDSASVAMLAKELSVQNVGSTVACLLAYKDDATEACTAMLLTLHPRRAKATSTHGAT